MATCTRGLIPYSRADKFNARKMFSGITARIAIIATSVNFGDMDLMCLQEGRVHIYSGTYGHSCRIISLVRTDHVYPNCLKLQMRVS